MEVAIGLPRPKPFWSQNFKPPFPIRLSEIQPATPEEEKRLLTAAFNLLELKPWEELSEDEFLAVGNPSEPGVAGVCHVTGGENDYYALMLYRDQAAFIHLQTLLDSMEYMTDPESSALAMLQIGQIQVSFEKKSQLEPRDKQLLDRHKSLLPKGTLLPSFRSIQPGYAPWYIDGAEARFLTHAIEQYIAVITRPDFDADQLGVMIQEFEDDDEELEYEIFARLPEFEASSDGPETWVDGQVTPRVSEAGLRDLPDLSQQAKVIKAKSVTKSPLEISLMSLPIPLGESDERPCFPATVLLAQDGELVGNELTCQGLAPRAAPELLTLAVSMLEALPNRPREIWLSDEAFGALEEYEADLGVKIVWKDEPEIVPVVLDKLAKEAEAAEKKTPRFKGRRH